MAGKPYRDDRWPHLCFCDRAPKTVTTATDAEYAERQNMVLRTEFRGESAPEHMDRWHGVSVCEGSK